MADINWQLVSYIIVGLASGLTGAIIAPLIHWRIEKKRQERQHKYELVQQWRDMLAQLSRTLDHDEGRPNAPMYYLERDAAFLSLEEHLSPIPLRRVLGNVPISPHLSDHPVTKVFCLSTRAICSSDASIVDEWFPRPDHVPVAVGIVVLDAGDVFPIELIRRIGIVGN